MSATNPVRASALVLGSIAVSLLGSVICVGLSGILKSPSAHDPAYPEPSPGIPVSRPASQPASKPDSQPASRPKSAGDAAPSGSTDSRAADDRRPSSRAGSTSRTAAAMLRDPFFLPEERAAGTTLVAMWQRSDDDAAARRTAAETAAAEAAALAARLAGAVAPPPASLVSETDLAAARALRVRGVVRSPDGVWVVLATGRFTVGDPLPALPFVIDAVLADSVVLRAGAITVHLPITRPGSRPGAVKAIQ